MSLTYENYRLVGRTYLRCLFDQTNENCSCYNCSFCIRGKKIRLELYKNGYQTFNKDVQCWKMTENSGKVSVSPSHQWFFAVIIGFDETNGYLSFCIKLIVVCRFYKKWNIQIFIMNGSPHVWDAI